MHVNRDVNRFTYMNASISVVCYKSKTLSNGENPLMLQISKNGKRKYQSLGVSINPVYWDFIKGKPKPNCPNGELIQKILLDKVTEIQKQILEFSANQQKFTPTKLLESKKTAIKENTVGEFYAELLLNYKQTDKTGNRLVYKMSYNSIKEFSKGRLNILFADIDINWLNKYENWLRSKSNKETTISLLFRTLRSAYNKAVVAKIALKTTYPFGEFKISKFDVKTKKRAITKEDMLKIIKIDLSEESESIRFTRDIFIFSYLCGGINFTDIANLKPINIIENRLEYVRQKTGKEISLHLSREASQIISSYSKFSEVRGFLFPILKKHAHITAIQKQNRIRKILGKIDKDLKDVAKKCEINVNLTTYVARHTFATVLKRSGINIALISESLGHSSEQVTQIYLDSFENSQIDEAMKCLL